MCYQLAYQLLGALCSSLFADLLWFFCKQIFCFHFLGERLSRCVVCSVLQLTILRTTSFTALEVVVESRASICISSGCEESKVQELKVKFVFHTSAVVEVLQKCICGICWGASCSSFFLQVSSRFESALNNILQPGTPCILFQFQEVIILPCILTLRIVRSATNIPIPGLLDHLLSP